MDIILYIGSFITIWLGSGLILDAIDHSAKRLKISSFALSFFVLGLLTSIPEFAVGLTSVARGEPEIFVGNLLGASIVVFLLVIPLLAVAGKGIRLTHQFSLLRLLFILLVIVAPTAVVFDQYVSMFEGAVLIGVYLLLLFSVERDGGMMHNHNILHIKSYSLRDIIKLLLGIGIVFMSSRIIVEETISFSQRLQISEYVLSLLVLGIGTNLPELTLALRSVVSGKKEIAFGDYMGSAAANTLLFGLFTLLNKQSISLHVNLVLTTIVTSIGLGVLYLFARSGRMITRKEGLILMSIYVLFVVLRLIWVM